MEANFDLLVSGCSTRCRHCYVNGGPGRNMPLRDALLCIEKLDELAAALPFSVSMTLDNEPMLHPDVIAIIRAASGTKHIKNFHHGMTTGIALIERKDRSDVMKAYLDCGCDEFGITLHGSAAHHDELVRRKGAHAASLSAARFMRSCGARLSVSLMLNRFFAEDADDIDAALRELRPDYIYFAIPNYTPHDNMPGFEPYRASMETLLALRPRLKAWQQDEEELFKTAENGSVRAAVRQLGAGVKLRELFAAPQEELYLTVHPDRRLYLGNTGAETLCLGDLKTLDIAGTAALIARQPGNRDYGAFYNTDVLPDESELIGALQRIPEDLLFSDMPSAICRGLADMGIPTILLKQVR